MIKTLSLLAAAAFVLAPGSLAIASDAGTASKNATALSAGMHDVSAAKKKKKTKVRVYNQYGYEPAPRATYGWRGMDPVYPPNPEIAWRRSIGQCVIDLGYGRWETCDGPSFR